MTVVWCIERSNKNFPKSLFKTLYSLKFHFSWTRHVIWLLCFYCFYLLSSESISNDSFGCEDTEWCMCFSTENNTEQIICRWQTVSVVSAENGNWSEVRVLDSPVIPNTDKRNKSCHKFISYPWNKSLLQLTPSPSSSQSSRTIRVWCVCGGGGGEIRPRCAGGRETIWELWLTHIRVENGSFIHLSHSFFINKNILICAIILHSPNFWLGS